MGQDVKAAKHIGVGDLVITPRDRSYVNQVLRSNRLSYGPWSRRFEQKFAGIHDSKFAIFTNSGTSCLHIAISALKERYHWEDGDEVIVPGVTFVATSNVVLHNNLKPVFVDVERTTYNIDPAKISPAITDRTRAILPVHLLGLPADMAPILKIANRHRLRIVEDSAETMFARYRGRAVGSFGDVGCFSTYVAHYIVTGVGGLNTTSDARLAVHLRSLANHGRDSIYMSIDDDKAQGPRRFREVVKRRFRFVRVGHSFRATEMEAALGYSQLLRWRQIYARRRANARRLIRGLRDLSEYLQLPATPTDRDHAFMLFGLVTLQEKKRNLIDYLENRRIETRDLLPLTNQPAYQSIFPGLKDRLPVASFLNEHGFYVGCHQYLGTKDIDYVVKSIHRFYRR